MQQQGENGVRDKTAPTPSPERDRDAASAEAGRAGLGPRGDRISHSLKGAGDEEVLTCVWNLISSVFVHKLLKTTTTSL